MSKTLSTLKKLATCLGCCECTEDNTAETNAEAIEFICKNIGSVATQGVTDMVLYVDTDGKLVRGLWLDSKSKGHGVAVITVDK